MQYSPDDRQSWVSLAANLTETELDIDPNEIAGGDAAWVRVVASDGLNMATDEVGPIQVPEKAPRVLIATPEQGATLQPGAPVAFEATGYDPEDGGFLRARFVWTSDRDGELGSGDVVVVPMLSRGSHRVTVSAEDSNGNIGSATVDIQVGCVGDCNSDGETAINELITGVGIVLGNFSLDVCPAFDVNGDDQVAVNELVGAVRVALDGCTLAAS